jgi:hypothetical protein
MFVNPGLDGMTVCEMYIFSHFLGLILSVPDHLSQDRGSRKLF